MTSEDSDSDFEKENTPSNARTATGWSWIVVSPMRKFFDWALGGVQNLTLLGRETPVDYHELYLKDVWELTVEQISIYGHQKRKDGKTQH
ncbi:hypothetical protein KIN20_028406 [Parelaphostrongylus tenuis]|uniref:Uncharacterized protein n=1 Tax=Parelaphostrongylus tenuis TaxID=148309 RepID=A0AAD5R0T5_PARTN|nr:hypothetical protein KIN20_028406 [Parelaphostrongylus tenuis]